MHITPLVYIIIVNYNGYRDTIECINSLSKIDYKNYKIVIVDNGSKDDSVKNLKEYSDNYILIDLNKNLGFAGGNNVGIKYALDNGADYVLLLNNDTIVEKSFLRYMLDGFKYDNNIGIVGCKIMYYSSQNIIWYGGGKIDWFKFFAIHFGMKEIDENQCETEKKVDFITGCCMLIKKEVFKSVGDLSEEYFMYYEDVDYCVKVEQAGYDLLYNPKAIIYHKVGLSSGGEQSTFYIEWNTRNRLAFMNKYKYKVGFIKFILSYLFFYCTRCIKCFNYLLLGKKENVIAIKKAIMKTK